MITYSEFRPTGCDPIEAARLHRRFAAERERRVGKLYSSKKAGSK